MSQNAAVVTETTPAGMSPLSARLCLLFALIGLGAACTAAYVHYRVIADPLYTSFCDVGSTFNCSQVYSSRFGSVAGISVAIFGGIFFAFALLLSAAGLTARPAVRESVPGYLFAASTIGLAVILYLGYASFMILHLVCILCLITYAAVIGLFIVSGAATSIPMMTLPRRLASDLGVLVSSPIALVLTLVVASGAGSALAFFPRDVKYDANATTAAASICSSCAACPRISSCSATTVAASRITRRSLTMLLATNIATCRSGWGAPFGTVCGAGFDMRRVYRSEHERHGRGGVMRITAVVGPFSQSGAAVRAAAARAPPGHPELARSGDHAPPREEPGEPVRVRERGGGSPQPRVSPAPRRAAARAILNRAGRGVS